MFLIKKSSKYNFKHFKLENTSNLNTKKNVLIFSNLLHQANKHPRRRANTLESGTLQNIRQGRRGRGAGSGSSVRRRDSSGGSNVRGATPVLGRRSDAPLERAASSHSIFYPDSPGRIDNPYLKRI